MGDVVPIRSPGTLETGGGSPGTADQDIYRHEVEASDDSHTTEFIRMDSLYPDFEGGDHKLSKAWGIIEEGIKLLERSHMYLMEEDIIKSDDTIHHLQALLPELFLFRDIGEGFATGVSSVFYSILNLRGQRLNEEQINSLRKMLQRLLTEPYISFEDMVEEVESLENVSLEPISKMTDYIAEALDD